MYRKGKKYKYLFVLLVVLSLIFPVSSESQLVFAEDEITENNLEHNTPKDPMYGAENGVYKNEDVDYGLDLVSPSQIEEKGFFDKVWDTVTFQFVGEGFSEAFHYSLFKFLEFQFDFNIFMTNAMISILNFAYDTNLVEMLVDSIEGTVVSITGISGGQFTSNGIFGGFLKFIGITVALYTLYQLVIKRASISAFSGLFKSVVVLVTALFLFTHYTTVIKGINTLSVEASAFFLSGNAGTVINDGNIVNTNMKEKMNDNLFNTFVHKPYLMLQYGTTNQEDIGDDRVQSLLSKDRGTTDRSDIAVKEVTEYGNDILTYSKLSNRLNFMGIVLTANAFNSIPVYLLALCLILFQFWFIIIAMIAPFALLWASLPNQIGVLKRYTFELCLPLALKIGVSFLAILVFGLSEIMYGLSSLGSGSRGIFISTIIQGLLLFTLFLLRKRIFAIFSLGSQQLNVIREEMNNAFIKPIKKGVQTTATAIGTVGGVAVAGPQGAMVGMSMGNSVGNALTGETDVSDSARNVGMSMYMADRMKDNQQRKDNIPNLDSRETRIQTNEERAMELANNDTSYNRLRSYLQSKELPTETVNETLLAVDKLNLEHIEMGEIQKQFNNMAYLTKKGKLNNKLFADSFAKGIKINREQNAIRRSNNIQGKPIQSNPVEKVEAREQVAAANEMGYQNETNSEYNLKTYSLENIPENNMISESHQQEEYRLENNS